MGLGSWFRGLFGGGAPTNEPASTAVDLKPDSGSESDRESEPDSGSESGSESDRRGSPYRVPGRNSKREKREPAGELFPDGLTKRFPPRGPIQSAETTRDLRVHGVPCKAGTMVTFHANGRLYTASLAIDWTCDDVQLPAGAVVGFRSDGTLQTWYAELPASRTVCGLELPAGTRVSVVDGKLETLRLVEPATIAGHPFPAGAALGFDDNGVLSSATVGEPITIRGVPCAEHETIQFYADGTLHEAWLAEDTPIDGVPCMGHEIVRFFESGRLARCYVSREFELDGVPCAEGTRIYLNEAGRLLEGEAARDVVIDGVPCPAGREIVLDGDGRLSLAYPAHDFEVAGIPCRGPARIELDAGVPVRVELSRAHAFGELTLPAQSVVFLERGRPRVVTIVEPAQLFGRAYPAHTLFEIDAAGALIRTLPLAPTFAVSVHASYRMQSCVLGRDVEIDGIPCRAQSSFRCYDDGGCEELALARDAEVAGLPGRGTTSVRFHKSGKLLQITLARDTTIGGVPCKGATVSTMAVNDIQVFKEYVRLHDGGGVEFATLAAQYSIAGVTLAADHSIALHPDGTLNVGTLAENGRVGDHELRAGTLIAFYPGRRFRSGTLVSGTAIELAETGEQRHAERAAWQLDVAEV